MFEDDRRLFALHSKITGALWKGFRPSHLSNTVTLVVLMLHVSVIAYNLCKAKRKFRFKSKRPRIGTPSILPLNELLVLQAALSVALALELKGKTPLVRIGTDLRMDELQGHPIIAIGSFSNPWTEQNVAGLRSTFDRGASDKDPPRIRDARNPGRSWSLPSIYSEPQDKDYAIVTRTFDPVTREPFISLAGLHSFGKPRLSPGAIQFPPSRRLRRNFP